MLNFNLAVLLIVAIWVILIAGLVIWFLIARSRRKKLSAAEQTPVHRRSAIGDSAASASPTTGMGNLLSGQDATQPVGRLLQQPPSGTTGPEPFGLTTQREYERLATEPFQAPPATALGERNTPDRFSWTEASRSDPKLPNAAEIGPTIDLAESSGTKSHDSHEVQPAPQLKSTEQHDLNAQSASSTRKATGITNEPVAPPSDDLDRTVVVSRAAAAAADFGWSLVLPDGDALPLSADCVIGRRPTVTDGSMPVVIADPTRTLSKSHARLRFDDGRWRVSDLGSTNGLWLLHASGIEEEIEPYEEVDATSQLRLGTLEVELREGRQDG